MLQGAAWCVLAFACLLGLAYYVRPAEWLDAAALHGFVALNKPGIGDVAYVIAHLGSPFPYVFLAAGVFAYALAKRGLRTAAAAGLLLVGANVSSQVLKPLLADHRELYYTQFHLNNISDASFPSGHATAAMALALAALMVAPVAYRPLVATLGGVFAIAVTFSLLALSWHFPSDVVGGYLLATAWGLVSLAALRYVNERWPEPGTVRQAAKATIAAPSLATIAKLGAVLATGMAIGAASRAHEIAGFADRHTAMVAVGGAIAVSAAVLLTAVALISGTERRSQQRGH